MNAAMQFFKGFREGMHDFSSSISTIVNSTLLTIVYLIGVGVTALLAKMFKKKFLEISCSEKKESYWSDCDLKKKPLEEYYRQFLKCERYQH